MPFDWLVSFQKEQEKPADYAEKTLAAYRLGIKAGGSIYGVRIEVGRPTCPAASALPPGMVYYPALPESPSPPAESPSPDGGVPHPESPAGFAAPFPTAESPSPDGVVTNSAHPSASPLPPAPRLPLPGCTHPRQCRCVYRPVMTYQVPAAPESPAGFAALSPDGGVPHPESPSPDGVASPITESPVAPASSALPAKSADPIGDSAAAPESPAGFAAPSPDGGVPHPESPSPDGVVSPITESPVAPASSALPAKSADPIADSNEAFQ